MASVRGLLNIQSLNELTYENQGVLRNVTFGMCSKVGLVSYKEFSLSAVVSSVYVCTVDCPPTTAH